jgi:hypothetical protein
MAVVGTFLYGLFALAIIADLLSSKSQTPGVINSLSGLLSNSVKAAQG